MKKENNNGLLIIVLLIIISIIVLFFPKINNYIISFSIPKVEKTEEIKKKEKKEITEDILETIHFPLMRNSIYESNSYYTLDVLTVNDIFNKDILLTAFLDLYEGNITNYNGFINCATEPKQFNSEYLELRIKNIISNTIDYKLESFYVPEDSNSKYIGDWIYDEINNRYIYYGLCNTNRKNISYYDLEQLIKMEYKDNDIVTYYYVGFAKVEGNSYTIYSDIEYTNVLASGTFVNIEDLNDVFEKINNKDKKIYRYIFKNNLCSYSEYCLYEGRWVNEL